jgi:hypothetical protein
MEAAPQPSGGCFTKGTSIQRAGVPAAGEAGVVSWAKPAQGAGEENRKAPQIAAVAKTTAQLRRQNHGEAHNKLVRPITIRPE